MTRKIEEKIEIQDMIMKSGIQMHQELSIEEIQKAGFVLTEIFLDADDILQLEDNIGNQYKNAKQAGLAVVGITVPLWEIQKAGVFSRLLIIAAEKQMQYIVIETKGTFPIKSDIILRLSLLIEEHQAVIDRSDLEIYIENGYEQLPTGAAMENAFSDARQLQQFVQKINRQNSTNCCKIAWNIGYANLLQKNLPEEISLYKGMIGLVHVNDNDGYTDQKQMPHTFTVGRGTLSTDWYRIIGRLIRSGFHGWLMADTAGLWSRAPKPLHPSMLCLLNTLYDSWKEQIYFEELLNQPEKKLILFGAGKMAGDYMKAWGEKYPPAYLVDNDSKKWGTRRFGIEIISPQRLLAILPEERNLLICNMYYDAVKEQLDEMGISYQCYIDQYYF